MSDVVESSSIVGSSSAVLFEERAAVGGKKLGIAMLNAEKSLNSLSHEMVELLLPKLKQWQADDAITAVFLHSAGEKSFCAGGDVVALHSGSAGYGEDLPNDSCTEFFAEEYRLDYLIHTFGKPFVVWGSGIVMGGGVGLLSGASHRIVTDTTRMAMPEITIGLYPDVGGTWFLNRTPGKTGLFLGLTGAHINGNDALYVGLADHFITHDLREEVITALTEVKCARGVDGVMEHFSQLVAPQRPAGQVEANIDWITRVCTGPDVATVVAQIRAYDGDDTWRTRAIKTLTNGCPVTPYLVWEQLQRGKGLSLEDVFRLELIMSVNCAKFGHFKEGVRALLIDKDRNPQWTPSKVEDVTADMVEAFFVSPWEVHPLADL